MKELNKEFLIRFLASSICIGIGELYGQISVENAIKNEGYDIVVIADPSKMEVDVEEQDEDEDSEDEDEDDDFDELDDSEIQAVQAFGEQVKRAPARDIGEFDRGKVAPYLELERPLRSDTAPWTPPIPRTTDENNKNLYDKFDSILGFMVVQKGECLMIPGAYSVNLICAKEGAPKGIGALLMGLYLETILKRPDITQIALLELAGGYLRLAALCLYAKFGFMPDPSMLNKNCFTSAGNMPMILYLGNPKITREGILRIASGVDNRGFKPSLCLMTPKNQFVLSSLYEYYRLFNYVMENKITGDEFSARCQSKPNLETVFNYINTNYTGKTIKYIHDYIKGIISKLEKGDQSVGTDPLIQLLGGVDGGKPKRMKRTRTKRIARKKTRTRKHKNKRI
jgi:hypothetical protein